MKTCTPYSLPQRLLLCLVSAALRWVVVCLGGVRLDHTLAVLDDARGEPPTAEPGGATRLSV